MADTMEQQAVGTAYTYDGVTVAIGDRVTTEQIEALPVGAVINTNPDPHQPPNLWTKQPGRIWLREDGRRIRANDIRSARNLLWSVPEGVLARQETIDEYKARFRAKVLRATEVHLGPNDRDVLAILDKLGVPGGGMVEGAVVRQGANFPDGVVVMFADPSSPDYHVWERKDGQWVIEYGTAYDSPDRVMQVTVIEVPDTVMRTEPNDTDADAIAVFKAAAWSEGWKLKRARRWCQAYEQIMADVGLTPADSMPDFSAYRETVDWRDLPDGAVLAYQGRNMWDMAVRDGSTDSGLRRIAGTSTGGLARNRWRIIHDGRGQMSVDLPSELRPHVPVGSVMRYSGTRYTRHEDGRWHDDPDNYQYRDSDFGGGSTEWVGTP